MANNHEFGNYASSPESNTDKVESVEAALETIDKTKQFIAEHLDLDDKDLILTTEEALSYVAIRTYEDASANGDITGMKEIQIKEAVEAVIVGAVNEDMAGTSPILELKEAGLGKEVDTAIRKFKETDAKLPNGESVAEKIGELLGVPEVLWRGERRYLSNIDQIGKVALSTKDHERKGNQNGRVHMGRDKEFATTYSIGTDGVVWYDGPLSKEDIPIGVVYKIDNTNNIINAIADDDPLPDLPELGELAGKCREFTTTEVPPEFYTVAEIHIMDDYNQPNGHKRSDFRQILETFVVESPEQLPDVIEKVKARTNELDALRQAQQG